MPYGTIQRYQLQSLPSAAEAVEPRGQCSESFIVSLAESLDCLRNVFTRERGIMLDAQLKGEQSVIRARIGMFFQRIGYFEKSHRGCGLWRGRAARAERKRGLAS